jgi:predicted DNA-binding transcriptional regulator AlpA
MATDLREVSLQHSDGTDRGNRLLPGSLDSRAIRQLVRAKDVAKKLGVSISWVIQHASGKRKPYLPAVKMGPGRSPLRFDPGDVEKFIDECRRLAAQRAGCAGR